MHHGVRLGADSFGEKKTEWKVHHASSSCAPPWPNWRLVTLSTPIVFIVATWWCGRNLDLQLEFRFHNPKKLSCEHSKSAHVWVYWNALGGSPSQMDVSSQTKIALWAPRVSAYIENFYYTRYVMFFFVFFFHFFQPTTKNPPPPELVLPTSQGSHIIMINCTINTHIIWELINWFFGANDDPFFLFGGFCFFWQKTREKFLRLVLWYAFLIQH